MRAVKIWLWVGVFMVFIQVLIGGITRLTGSGLSITEWSVIMGAVPPTNAAQWNDAFEQYKQFPQYQLVNQHFTLSEFKNIFWWEYLHRNWARLIGLVFLFPFIWFWIRKTIDRTWKNKLWIVFLLGGLQGLMGWIMVASGLIDMPWVSPYNLTMHLLLALLVFCYLQWLALSITNKKVNVDYFLINKNIKIILALVIAQIIFGGFMAGTKAGMIMNTYPLMEGKFIPDGLNNHTGLVRNIFENTIAINFIHRTLAAIVFISIITFVIRFRKQENILLRRLTYALGIFICIQFLLGVCTLLEGSGGIPITLGVLHQSVAFICTFFIVAILFYSRKRNTTPLIN
ncbi:MAG: COX15/CtaA family protein [Chitinophagales bacterium]|nr:COX15/CtaA family protein [Bacteroidota bacterium]MBP7400347.1 COX15/CtaA family protein [Chitinophagales bacterium]MBK8683179.1 COX15/CtaA family protein [Bacteroidota bacterium]MBP8754991.1 COX15/CtaA family protein [Chitinophagales bacterium]MBP9190701.1 COX15/CtaA family protein [Chitinophagales bacterium]